MTVTETNIANSALIKIGADMIDDIDEVIVNKSVNQCREQFSKIRDEVLRAHPWNSAMRRSKLQGNIVTITNATTGDPVAITASNDFEDNDHITIADVVGMTELNALSFLVANATSVTFDLQDEDGNNVDGSAYTPYTSGGTARLSPAFQYEYQYKLPTNALRVIRHMDPVDPDKDYEYKIEGNYLLTDEDEAYVRWIVKLTDPDKWDSLLREAVALRLAVDLAYSLSGNRSLVDTMKGLYDDKISEAASIDGQEGTLDVVSEDEWIDVRS